VQIPSYDPKTGEVEMLEVDFSSEISEENKSEEEGE
jgi:hypothetical protein